ncbi:MAG: helix-turn-helix domain-containing protein, partial [Candidatus Woesearchaeota archaeon]
MNKELVLQQFGLTDAEARVYITLLQKGDITASEIAKKTGANRTFTYDRLKKLSESGLVSSIIKDNKKYFKAAPPSQLLSLLKEREEQIKKILPELEQLKEEHENGPEVEVYSTTKGVQTALNLMLKEKKSIYLHGSLFLFQEKMSTYFTIWNSRRIKEKIKMRILSSEEITLEYTATDLLSEEEKLVTSTFVFGEYVLTVMWGNLSIAILIKSKEIVNNTLAFFNTIWNRDVKIYVGVTGIQRAFMELIENTKEFVGFGFSKQLADVYTVNVSNNWHEKRIKKKVKTRIVAFDENQTRIYFNPRTQEKKDFIVHFLPREMQGPACISVSDKMVATFVYTEKKFHVIINKNKETVAVYKKY